MNRQITNSLWTRQSQKISEMNSNWLDLTQAFFTVPLITEPPTEAMVLLSANASQHWLERNVISGIILPRP